MRVLDLFAGIGGITLGLEMAGYEAAGLCEIDDSCRKVLSRHWPTVPLFSDIRLLSARDVADRCGAIDVIAGGFPCQPHSFAGERRGARDERNLWPEFFRIVRETRPNWVIAENVPGIISTIGDDVIGDLEAAGYKVWPLILGANVFGAPHKRRRVWYIANANDESKSSRPVNVLEGGGVPKPVSADWWQAPVNSLARGDNGVPNRMDRIRMIGNAVVPAVARAIGLAIIACNPPQSR